MEQNIILTTASIIIHEYDSESKSDSAPYSPYSVYIQYSNKRVLLYYVII